MSNNKLLRHYLWISIVISLDRAEEELGKYDE